jgi:hypothetical protein
MKKLLLLTALVFSMLSPVSALAQDTNDALRSIVLLTGNARVELGMTPEQVTTQLGAPSVKLGDEVWAYWDFRAAGRPRGERYNALLVVFAKGRTSVLRLTERLQVEVAVARLQRNSNKVGVVAGK